MARHNRLHVLTQMKSLGLVPLFFNGDADTACKLVLACAEGGCPLVEFTDRGDRAIDVFKGLAEWRDHKATLGKKIYLT